MSEDWDVDSYKSEFENEDHWQLRRSFMLAHKDKFPEDELVCLAQVFTNIEFMGCRYPDKTMMRVAELAKGVVEKFRDERKNSLKRTFVAASDAASAKVKGQVCKGEEGIPSKKSKSMDQTEKNVNVGEAIILQEKSTKAKTSNIRVPKYGGVKTFNIKQTEQTEICPSNKTIDESNSVNEMLEMPVVKSDGPIGDFVLILQNAYEHPVSIIQRNASLNKCTIRWDFEECQNKTFACKLFLNNTCIATSTRANMKMSKEHTAMVAIAKLREVYYGIRIKSGFFSDTAVSPDQLGSSSKVSLQNQLGEDNVGRKLLKLMGWQGGGLGNKGQGREEPVIAQLHVRRDGLGLGKNMKGLMEFKIKAREYVKSWIDSNSEQDLVFSSDFTVEERKVLHEIASHLSLKSKSHGKDANRQLVISRKCEPLEILRELLKTGGNSDKYELLYPTNT